MIPLTDREREVLEVLCGGASYKEAGEKLFMSIHTVHWYVWAILAKTETHKILQAGLKTGVLVRGGGGAVGHIEAHD